MYFTPYVKHDGYWESICSLQRTLTPVLKCRAVIKANGSCDSIVRDYLTGKVVAFDNTNKETPAKAQDAAMKLAADYIGSDMVQAWE
jgi:hypothetical protein